MEKILRKYPKDVRRRDRRNEINVSETSVGLLRDVNSGRSCDFKSRSGSLQFLSRKARCCIAMGLVSRRTTHRRYICVRGRNVAINN